MRFRKDCIVKNRTSGTTLKVESADKRTGTFKAEGGRIHFQRDFAVVSRPRTKASKPQSVTSLVEGLSALKTANPASAREQAINNVVDLIGLVAKSGKLL